MKYLFYIGLVALAVFEICKVYFIMPMPGSQEIDTLDLAYFLHVHRWSLRAIFIMMTIVGAFSALQTKRKWAPAVSVVLVLIVVYMFNFRMLAEKMFSEPEQLLFGGRLDRVMEDSAVVIAVEHGGIAKAYPVRYLSYHHQVRDTLSSMEIMVTYCNVCRTGRVFDPIVNGESQKFRLVGMDHFNAMFEDERSGSWWRQATGEAVAGAMKGTTLAELESTQMTAGKFFALHPFGRVMLGDRASSHKYDSLGKFEKGRSKSNLTRTDSLSWRNKSWVVGIQIEGSAKAYDWNDLKKARIIHDVVGKTPVLLVLSDDSQSFAAFQRAADQHFTMANDTIKTGESLYDLKGTSLTAGTPLTKVSAYQEFWHSWKTFHPNTSRFGSDQ